MPGLRTRSWLGASSQGATFECTSCHRQTSVTAGTILHGSKLDLTVWFWAAYLMATHSNGISALQLQKQLALGSYRTAWMLAAKLRRAMVDPDRNPLSGLVEIDETSLPFRTKNDPAGGGPGRSHDGKLLVVGGIEVGDGNKPGRLRLAALTDYGAGSLNAFIARNIAPASTAKTDGWAGYAGVPVNQHDPHVIGAMAAHLVLPWIHQMFSNLKGWARGVYHGLRRKYLQTYLDEFVFRFNRRRTRHATLPLPVRHRHPRQTCHLQHVGCAGTKCISGSDNSPPTVAHMQHVVGKQQQRSSQAEPTPS